MVSSVRSCVEPPAPKVTEKNSGLSSASCLRVAVSFSTPSGVCGGKNSKLISVFYVDCLPCVLTSSCVAAELSAQEKILYKHCAQYAVPETVNLNPRRMEPANQNISPLMTKMNRPSVSTVTGNVSTRKQRADECVDEAEHQRRDQRRVNPSTCMPGTKFATASNASELNIQISRSRNSILVHLELPICAV